MSYANNFSEYSYMYRRGRNKALQCCKPTDMGFCVKDTKRLKMNNSNLHKILLKENLLTNNVTMMYKCIDSFVYDMDYMLNINHDYIVSIYNQWLKSKSHTIFLTKYSLLSDLPIIKDVIGIIKNNYYFIEYNKFINVYNQL